MPTFCTATKNREFCPIRNKCSHYKGLMKLLSDTPPHLPMPSFDYFDAPFIRLKGGEIKCPKMSLTNG
jgi:hypothetical protein